MKLHLSPWVPAALCAAYHFFPDGSFLSFLIATCVHELGHIVPIALADGNIRSIRLSLRGAVIETEGLSDRQEAVCAIAGPLAGLLLVLFFRVDPWLAFWGITQSLVNLFPVYPLDGGRALGCILPYLPHNIAAWITPLAFLLWSLAALALIL